MTSDEQKAYARNALIIFIALVMVVKDIVLVATSWLDGRLKTTSYAHIGAAIVVLFISLMTVIITVLKATQNGGSFKTALGKIIASIIIAIILTFVARYLLNN